MATSANLTGGNGSNGRLNGWKEISAYLGKSVRTVQRWEKDLGLPVRRIHGQSGEIVFALCAEIDAWMLKTEGGRAAHAEPRSGPVEIARIAGEPVTVEAKTATPKTDRNPWRAAALALAGVLLFVAGGWVVRGLLAKQPQDGGQFDGEPHRVEVREAKVTVSNKAGAVLWSKSYRTAYNDPVYRAGGHEGWRWAAVEDLDGDGKKEVLVEGLEENGETALRVIDVRTNQTYKFALGETMQFGTGMYGPPWRSMGFLLTDEPDGTKTVWVRLTHVRWYPSALVKLKKGRHEAGIFWSSGHISFAHPMALEGRRRMLVGATYNETYGASLAVLDYDQPTATSPVADPQYACLTCPAQQPLQYYVFPRTELSVLSQERPVVDDIRMNEDGNVILHVRQNGVIPAGGGALTSGGVFYTLSAAGKVIEAESSDNYRKGHATLEGLMRLDHPYSVECEAQVFPVRQWDGTRFVETSGRLAAPPRSYQAGSGSEKKKARLSATALGR